MEFWTWTVAEPAGMVDLARRIEAQGWDGIGVGDSQSLTGDPYVCLALAATVSDTLGLATSVTNPVTRHAAVTATSAFAIQRLSGGRMVLGIGRGDSALAHLGHGPARLDWFETYLEQLQAYLAGAEVPFDRSGIPTAAAPTAKRLGLAGGPQASSIRWVGEGPKVPVEVAATGPRVIGIAARHADRVMLAVGADPKRIAWGIDTAAGRELGRASTGLFARFSVMYGQVSGPADERQTDVFHRLHDHYDMNAHGQQGGQQTTTLTDDFIDRYAIVGAPGYCADRLAELDGLKWIPFETQNFSKHRPTSNLGHKPKAKLQGFCRAEAIQNQNSWFHLGSTLGVTKFGVIGPNFVTRTAEAQTAAARFTDDVLPRLRG